MATITVLEKAPQVLESRLSTFAPSDGWLADLHRDGYAVIKAAIAPEQARAYQQSAFAWLKSFGTALDLDDPSTWVRENLPVHGKINTFTTYGVIHEKFMWDARQEPGVLDTFAAIWGTDKLLASFDALNITLPNRADVTPNGAWPHVDQSPHRVGMHCVQGIINLSHAGPDDGSLIVIPGSHKHVQEFFATQLPQAEWPARDYYRFSDAQMDWYRARGLQPKKVLAEPGDLILWDSRTVHWGAEPAAASKTIRTVIYASYAPADLASAETLAAKRGVFEAWGATTHWANTNVRLLETRSLLPDGTRDPRDRDGPLEPPEMTDKLLRLAGVKPYEDA